ncbi:MAG: hypothetical protein ACKV2U_21770 [Bryobacteraceae bacterium]
MKHAARVASQFIHGSEAFAGGNEMIFPLTFREPYDASALWTAFERLVRENIELQRSYNNFQWTYCDALDRCLAELHDRYKEKFSEEELLTSYMPTGSGLPIRLARIDDSRAAMLVNHVFNNGATTLRWLERLLAFYGGAPNDESRESVQPAPWRMALGIASVASYLATFLARAGGAAHNTVDLSDGREPAPGTRYAVRAWRFTESQTAAIVAAAKRETLSVTEALTMWLAEKFFDARPAQTRVCISVPTDLTAWAQPNEPGNHTGSLIVQLFRGPGLTEQIKNSFRWARSGVHLWLPQMIGLFSSDQALFRQFARKAALPIPQRAPFENFTFAVSSVGVIRGPLAIKYLSEISAFTKTQTIFLCAMTLDGRLSWRVCVADGLFNPEEAFEIIDRVASRLREL